MRIFYSPNQAFLNHTTMSLVRNSTVQALLRARQCPVLTQILTANIHTRPPRERPEVTAQECPFLIGVPDSKSSLQSDVSMCMVNGNKVALEVDLATKAFRDVLEMNRRDPVSKSHLAIADNSSLSLEIDNRDLSTTAEPNLIDDLPTTTGQKVNKVDLIEGSFDYEALFERMLLSKKRDQSYRYFKKIERKGRRFPKASEHTNFEKEVIVWCSNDYMGMSWNQDVINAAKSAIDLQGTGSGGTRNISGNLILHETLEHMMANQHGKDAALVFTSCYVANQWALHSLGRFLPGCVFFCDAGNHASMIQGVVSSRAHKVIYDHNSLQDLERKLQTVPIDTPKVIVFESVHSMSGSMAPVEAICDLAHKYGALTFLDEVHAVGLYGSRGAGAAEEFCCAHKVDVVSGTFGKAYGNLGGYIAGSARLVDFVRSFASGFIFTTSLPPPVLAGALTAVRKLAGEEGRALRAKQRMIVHELRSRLQEADIPAKTCPTHIIPVHVGEPGLCLALSNELLHAHGIYVQSINFPTVARGEECLRIAPTPHHSIADVDRLVTALQKSWAKLGGPLLSELQA